MKYFTGDFVFFAKCQIYLLQVRLYTSIHRIRGHKLMINIYFIGGYCLIWI